MVVDPPEGGKLLEHSEICSNMFYFALARWMAAIQGYGRMCWHFCSVDEWFQPQLQQPWSLAGKSGLDLDEAVRTTSQKLIQARASANGLHPY